jgi:ubiquinone/menaquinone biosynthesis C-methylase UbiE
MQELNDYFTQKRVKKILDIGTGSGDSISVLKEVFPDTEIIGVDPNLNSLKEAGKRFPDVHFKEMSAENLDFEDKSFDIVSMSMALHHIPDVEKSLLEMQRVVNTGGWIIINELFSDNLSEAQKVHKMYHHFRSQIDRILGTIHNETFKKEEILNIIKISGIKILFHFEFHKNRNRIQTEKDIEERVEKMRTMLNEIKDRPEYKELEPQIAEFREKAKTFGFEMATRVVVVGQVQQKELL